MAIVYVPNTIEIAVIQTYANKPIVNVWHMGYETDIGDRDLSDVVEDFAGNWQDHVLLLVDSGLTLQRFEWRCLDPNDNQVGVTQPISGKPTVGGQAGTGMPPNVAMLVHKNTSNRPRGRRDGRCFLAGVQEGFVGEDGTIGSTELASFNGVLEDFYNGISDTGTFTDLERWPVVLETTALSRDPEAPPQTISNRRVTSITLDQLVATQRDRLR